ncbi:MAG: sensor histidine kinase [Oligoflexus sp.]
MVLSICLILSFFLASYTSQAEAWPSTAVIENSTEELNLFRYSHFLEDDRHSYHAENLLNLGPDAWINAQEFGRSAWGYSESSVWVRIDLINHSSQTQWYLGSQRPDQSIVQLFLFNQQGQLLAEQTTGADIPFTERPEAIRLPLASFDLPQDEKLSLLVKLQSPVHLTLPIYIYSPLRFRQLVDATNYTFAVYFGVMFSLLIYNFILFLMLRYKDFLFYCIFGSSMVINSMAQGGFFELLNLPFFFQSVHDVRYLMCLPPITAMLYTSFFLKLRVIAPLLNQTLLFMTGVYTVIAFAIASPWGHQLRALVSPMTMLCLLFVFTGSYFATRRRDPAAYTFAAAWGILAFLVGVWVLGNEGHIEKIYFVAFAPMYGNMVEMLLMSIALAIRIKQLEQQKQQAELKAQESEYLKKLLRVVCHDINNPLSVIMGTNWAVIRKKKRGQATEHLWERVDRASRAINNIITQVSQFESVQSGKISLQIVPVRIQNLFDEVKFLFQPKAEAKNIELIFTTESQYPDLMVLADSVSLTHQVLSNLLSNAIKFTPQGGRIHVSTLVIINEVRIRVEDNGIGIPQDILEKIFDSQANTSRLGTEQEMGTGFGMPLVKSFVEKLEGRIELRSQVGNKKGVGSGTCADIYLKLAVNSLQQTDPVELRQSI